MRADLTMMVYLSFLLEERQSQLNRVGGQVVHTGFFFVFCFFFFFREEVVETTQLSDSSLVFSLTSLLYLKY